MNNHQFAVCLRGILKPLKEVENFDSEVIETFWVELLEFPQLLEPFPDMLCREGLDLR